MREFTVTENDAGQRLDRFVSKAAPRAPSGLLQRCFRKKDIKLNGRWARPDARVRQGDTVRVYLPEEFFPGAAAGPDAARLEALAPRLDVLFEDENLLLVNKRPGVLCHAGDDPAADTLLAHVQAHVLQSGQWDPAAENSFAPALCNRLDRGTGGIVIAAKNAPALRVMADKLRDRELDKRYLCVCLGAPDPPEGRLENWLFKDAVKNRVLVKPRPEPGARTAVTDYRVLARAGELSLVECRLMTGRTHQIRAQLAHAGWPLLGDGKYGRERANRDYGERRQLLWSYRLAFDFRTDAGPLEYLRGRVFTVRSVPFAEKYFSRAPWG